MRFFISSDNTPIAARLKLLYLIPLFLILCIPTAFFVGFIEHTLPSIRMIINIIRNGRA
jgi:ABC-type polysaccharide/polyol phosphate export permease